MTEAYICDAVRTPIGRYGGALSGVRADDLAAIPIRALKERNHQVDWAALDDIILGCANQAGEDNRNLARMAGLLAGLPDSSGGVTLAAGVMRAAKTLPTTLFTGLDSSRLSVGHAAQREPSGANAADERIEGRPQLSGIVCGRDQRLPS